MVNKPSPGNCPRCKGYAEGDISAKAHLKGGASGLSKCQSDQPLGSEGGPVGDLWWGFSTGDTKDLKSFQVPNNLTSVEDCKTFLDHVLQLSNDYCKTAREQISDEAKQATYIENQKAGAQYQGQPITKAMLEYAVRIAFPAQAKKKAVKVKAPMASGSQKKTGGQQSSGYTAVDDIATSLDGTHIDQQHSTNTAADIVNVVIPGWTEATAPAYHTKSRDLKPFQKAIHSSCPIQSVTDRTTGTRTGKSGSATEVVTNYVEITSLPQYVYEYSIKYGEVIQEKPSTQTNNGDGAASTKSRGLSQRSQKKLVFRSLERMSPFAGRDDWATNYETIWSLKPLQQSPQTNREPSKGEVILIGQVDFTKTSGRPCSITGVELSFTRKLDFYSGGRLDPAKLLSALSDDGTSIHLTALNGLVSAKVSLHRNVISAGANRFYVKDDYIEFLGVQAHRGFFSSVRPGSDRVLLNIGTMTGTFYQPVTVSEFMDAIYAKGTDAFHEYGRTFVERCQKLLAGCEVRIMYDRAQYHTTYDPNAEANRHRTIADLGLNPYQQEISHEGRNMSVADYFIEILKSPEPKDYYPCVNVGVKQKRDGSTNGKQVYIPAEFVVLDPDQFFGRRLASPHMEALSNFAILHPAANQENIVSGGFQLLGLSGQNDGFMRSHFMVQPKLLSIPARFLDFPGIAYINENGLALAQVKAAAWNLANVKLYRPGKVPSAVNTVDLRLSHESGGDQKDLRRHMEDAMRLYGMVVPHGDGSLYQSLGHLRRSPPETMTDAGLHENLDSIPGRSFNIVILPDRDSHIYGVVKRVFDQHIGAHTVCITAPKLGKKHAFNMTQRNNQQLLANLALKFNLKLADGINHLVMRDNKRPAFEALHGTMVVGADVSHAPSQMPHCPSVAAVVASQDDLFGQFPGSMRLQASKQEFLQDLFGMMVERLLHYGDVNSKLPSRIIFYRDGVGEDMYARVIDQEIPAVKKAFKYVQDNFDELKRKKKLPPNFQAHQDRLLLTFIVVGKRHNTRFFCRSKYQSLDLGTKPEEKMRDYQKADAISFKNRGDPTPRFREVVDGNVKPGLVVDRVITLPAHKEIFDFFLQSHQALKGTARPAHYVVLEKGDLSVDDIQRNTFYFCYNFARTTKGVSYAGPAYYADRLADRGTHYLKAYTMSKESPDIEMSKWEKETVPRKVGLLAYDQRVASHVQNSLKWNPRHGQEDKRAMSTRINPWHPNLDTGMFWL